MDILRALTCLLCGILLAGCAGTPREPAPDATAGAQAPAGGAASLGSLPASYAGVLPCADCEGIRYRLNLFPDGVFFLEISYLGRGEAASFDDIGRWDASSDGRVLVLRGGREAPETFSVVDARALRKRDREGREIESVLNYTLVRSDTFEPIVPRLDMRGMYSYMADAASFTECLTGQRWPVVTEADNARLEREYLKARPGPGEPLLVSVRGTVEPRPAMEGDARPLSLIVERLLGVWPGESCGRPFVTEALENTYWKLTRLGERAVFVAEGQREPSLVLHPADHRFSGSGGCNAIAGSYALDGNRIELAPLAGTRMACAEGMDAEQAYLAALARVRSWRVTGQHLELYGPAGELLLRFEAVWLR